MSHHLQCSWETPLKLKRANKGLISLNHLTAGMTTTEFLLWSVPAPWNLFCCFFFFFSFWLFTTWSSLVISPNFGDGLAAVRWFGFLAVGPMPWAQPRARGCYFVVCKCVRVGVRPVVWTLSAYWQTVCQQLVGSARHGVCPQMKSEVTRGHLMRFSLTLVWQGWRGQWCS